MTTWILTLSCPDRATNGSQPIDVRAVVSNHTVLRPLADHGRVPFVRVPVTSDDKPAAEARLLDLVEELRIELVVHARAVTWHAEHPVLLNDLRTVVFR